MAMIPDATEEIRPFQISVPQEAIADLRARLRVTRFPNEQPVKDWSQGVPLAQAEALVQFTLPAPENRGGRIFGSNGAARIGQIQSGNRRPNNFEVREVSRFIAAKKKENENAKSTNGTK